MRLIPANYVKPFVKRQNNPRPGMSFVAVKSAEKQGRAVAFRTHQCFVRQRTQAINALRGHLAEFGLMAPKGPVHIKLLQNALAGSEVDLPAAYLPNRVREMGQLYLQQIEQLTGIITRLANELEPLTIASALPRQNYSR